MIHFGSADELRAVRRIEFPARISDLRRLPVRIASFKSRLVPRHRTRIFVAAVVGAGILVSVFASAAARAGDTDLTASALAARKAVGLPCIVENQAVTAAALALLNGSDVGG